MTIGKGYIFALLLTNFTWSVEEKWVFSLSEMATKILIYITFTAEDKSIFIYLNA